MQIPIKEDTLCNLDQITVITKLLHFKDKLGFNIQEKYLKFDFQNSKDLKDKVDTFFEKTKPREEDESMGIADDSTMD